MTFPSASTPNTKLILDLWNEKKTTLEIAEVIGCHESVVYNALARLGGEVMPARDIRHGRRA
ncbi:helix-turn-helix domain-containing protein [Agrobacterium rhizogenes]|uniref:hypothetical protein n=1 Tax=Rhizobium rhizogenes TaxID=359 RepID=UPI0015745010|nr:hypothetical protein [Rhizobium rhizogenes]NTG86179.1 helix-turn-helix domain-containing protein [Rhizobium rhizogenes]